MGHPRISHMPLSTLTLPDILELGMCEYMREIRKEANWARLRRSDYNNLSYLKGRLHGLWFGCSLMMIEKHWDERERLSDMFDAFRNEADYLSGTYIHEVPA